MTKIYYTNKPLEKEFNCNNYSDIINNHIENKNNIKAIKDSKRTWELLRQVLKNELLLEIKKLDIIFNENGKPISKEIFISLSHSADLSVVSISNSNVGIDVEKIIDNVRVRKLAKRLLKEENDDVEYFYKLFTSYESKIKYEGKTIGYPKGCLEEDKNISSLILNVNDDKFMLSYLSSGETKIIEF